MQTTSATCCIPFRPTLTVGAVMHEPRKPPYRRVEHPKHHKKKSPHGPKRAADSFMPDSTSLYMPWTAGEQEKAFMPTLTPPIPYTKDEAEETLQELRSFEKKLKLLYCHSPRSSASRGGNFSSLSNDMFEGVRASHSLTQVEEVAAVGSPPFQRTVVHLLPRLFSELLVENNSIVARLRELGREKVSHQLEINGKRLGMREVTSQELYFLLGCIFDERTLLQSDVDYLFRFFDWRGRGAMDFKELLSSVNLLFVSSRIITAVHCKRILAERVLDDSVIALAEVGVMFDALRDIFGAELEEVGPLCDEVRHAVEEVMPTHTVPISTLREEVSRFPTLTRCLSAVQWDGTIDWKSVCRGSLLKDHNRSREERQRELVRAAIAEGRGTNTAPVSEDVGELCMDVCHPRFVADQYRIHVRNR